MLPQQISPFPYPVRILSILQGSRGQIGQISLELFIFRAEVNPD